MQLSAWQHVFSLFAWVFSLSRCVTNNQRTVDSLLSFLDAGWCLWLWFNSNLMLATIGALFQEKFQDVWDCLMKSVALWENTLRERHKSVLNTKRIDPLKSTLWNRLQVKGQDTSGSRSKVKTEACAWGSLALLWHLSGSVLSRFSISAIPSWTLQIQPQRLHFSDWLLTISSRFTDMGILVVKADH